LNIAFDRISASYSKKEVLHQVSFCAHSGEITALIGRNGAGKTTLIRCLTGEKQDYSGVISLGDLNLSDLSLSRRAELLACLPQSLPIPHVTVRELVGFGRTPHAPFSGLLLPADLAAVEQAIEQAGLTALADNFVDTLSGGERKKAFFAMTLAQDTPVIVLDEPTAHLDMVSRFEFLCLVQTLCRETGKTLLLILHDLTDVLRYADRIVVLHGSSIAFDGTPDDCLSRQIPEQVFGIRIRGDRANGYSAVPVAK